MADWTQQVTDSADWTLQRASAGIFDGAVFDFDIFDGVDEFELQTTADPNWTPQT